MKGQFQFIVIVIHEERFGKTTYKKWFSPLKEFYQEET